MNKPNVAKKRIKQVEVVALGCMLIHPRRKVQTPFFSLVHRTVLDDSKIWWALR